MAAQVSMAVKVQHGDGSVMATVEHSIMSVNPQPRDVANDADLSQKTVDTMLEDAKGEIGEQLTNWKRAMFSLLGGGTE